MLNKFFDAMPTSNFSQSDYLILIVDINSHTKWQAVQIQISWLQKPTDLDLHYLQKQDISGFSKTRVNIPTWSPHDWEIVDATLNLSSNKQDFLSVKMISFCKIVINYFYFYSFTVTFTSLWTYSADNRLMIFFLFFPENKIWYNMQSPL